MKPCSRCGKVKEYREFCRRKAMRDGYRSECKECMRKDQKEQRAKTTEQRRAAFKEYYDAHREVLIKRAKDYYRANKETISAAREPKSREYRRKNRKRFLDYIRDRRKRDPMYAKTLLYRGYTHSAVNEKPYKCGSVKHALLGCSQDTLLQQLGEKPQTGAALDHIAPLIWAKNEEELRSLCHYTNLRWTTLSDNSRKSDSATPTGILLYLDLTGKLRVSPMDTLSTRR